MRKPVTMSSQICIDQPLTPAIVQNPAFHQEDSEILAHLQDIMLRMDKMVTAEKLQIQLNNTEIRLIGKLTTFVQHQEYETAKPTKKFKSNRYATKKTAGQGLMGVSLITSNTTKLKGVLDEGSEADYYVLIVTLLITSLLLQAVVGVLLMIIGSRESKLDCEANKGTKKTEMLNDVSMFVMFVITMVNVVLAAFTADIHALASLSPVDDLMSVITAPPTSVPTTPHNHFYY